MCHAKIWEHDGPHEGKLYVLLLISARVNIWKTKRAYFFSVEGGTMSFRPSKLAQANSSHGIGFPGKIVGLNHDGKCSSTAPYSPTMLGTARGNTPYNYR